MTTHKHTIELSKGELGRLQGIIRKGEHKVRVVNRSRILIQSHRGEGKDAIAERLGIGRSTVQRVRDRYTDGGLDAALYELPRSGQPHKITDAGEAHLVALATSAPPEGEERWTLSLLQRKMITDGKAPKEITLVALWKRLTARHIKPWREKNVVRPHAHAGVH
jgi:transposase